MTLFALSWFGNHSEAYTLAGIGHNLLWVTLGNTLSGAVFMGLGYWYATPKANRPVADKFNQTENGCRLITKGFLRGSFAYILPITRSRLSDCRRW
ncbi:nitrite transporter [Escherichia coli]|uniref:Nitrite transporter n=1 Tax=Escherichia coli TaxID=562 RepID=A0A377DAW7_ECOLX|nr:nitrite transporter [Escherichia coli]